MLLKSILKMVRHAMIEKKQRINYVNMTFIYIFILLLSVISSQAVLLSMQTF